jgi:hypothetical protein
MSVPIHVVDDEPDVAGLFRQRFRRELRADLGRRERPRGRMATVCAANLRGARGCSAE